MHDTIIFLKYKQECYEFLCVTDYKKLLGSKLPGASTAVPAWRF